MSGKGKSKERSSSRKRVGKEKKKQSGGDQGGQDTSSPSTYESQPSGLGRQPCPSPHIRRSPSASSLPSSTAASPDPASSAGTVPSHTTGTLSLTKVIHLTALPPNPVPHSNPVSLCLCLSLQPFSRLSLPWPSLGFYGPFRTSLFILSSFDFDLRFTVFLYGYGISCLVAGRYLENISLIFTAYQWISTRTFLDDLHGLPMLGEPVWHGGKIPHSPSRRSHFTESKDAVRQIR